MIAKGPRLVAQQMPTPTPTLTPKERHSNVRAAAAARAIMLQEMRMMMASHTHPPPTPTLRTLPTVSRSIDIFDYKTELGAAPWIRTPRFQDSAAACQEVCLHKSNGKCKFGTYVSGGPRKGECWLAEARGPPHRPCGVPCVSFLTVESVTSVVASVAKAKEKLLLDDSRAFGYGSASNLFGGLPEETDERADGRASILGIKAYYNSTSNTAAAKSPKNSAQPRQPSPSTVVADAEAQAKYSAEALRVAQARENERQVAAGRESWKRNAREFGWS